MYGAILGDMIGSPFEFDRGDKTKEFDLFSKDCDFTDDSVMTIAVGEALLAVGKEATVKEIEEAVVTNMQDRGKRYPYAGYGGRFRHWLRESNPKPYGSYGNGSAMRVSAAGWLYDSMERTREVARATANVTHNHPEGIKGAEATASAIYMARNGSRKKRLKNILRGSFIIILIEHLMKSDRDIIWMRLVREQYQRQLLHFWNPKILRMPYGMQYHLVEILTHLALLQAVLQKHFMEFRLYWLQSAEVGSMKD